MKTRSLIAMMAVCVMFVVSSSYGQETMMGNGKNVHYSVQRAVSGDTTLPTVENGKSQHGPSPVLSGATVTVSGTVTEISSDKMKDDLKINTGTEVVTVSGIGPVEYWDSLKITRPAVGDSITVEGYKLTTPDNSQIIFAAKITIGSNQVQLIDTTTGKPLFQPTDGNPGQGPMNILSGTAVTITGTVTEVVQDTKPAPDMSGKMNAGDTSAMPKAGDMPAPPKDDLKINTGSAIVTVSGIGPTEYWSSLKITPPAVGDSITVNGYQVTLPDNSQQIFAAKITIGSNQVQLIDTATGKPIWQTKDGNPGEGNMNILSGTAVTITGTVTEVDMPAAPKTGDIPAAPKDGDMPVGHKAGDMSAAPKAGDIPAGPMDGLKINTGSGIVTVSGIGPTEYWSSLKITPPAVGDSITVNGYQVTLPDNSQQIIAAKITIGSNQVQLIDTTTGRPLWQQTLLF